MARTKICSEFQTPSVNGHQADPDPAMPTHSPNHLGREHRSGLPRPDDWGSGLQPGGELKVKPASEPLRVRNFPGVRRLDNGSGHMDAHQLRILLRLDDTRPGPESNQIEPGPTTTCPPNSSVVHLITSGRPPIGRRGRAGEGVCQVRLPSRVGGAPLDVDSSLRMAKE